MFLIIQRPVTKIFQDLIPYASCFHSQKFSCLPFENYSLPSLKKIISWQKISWDREKDGDKGKS
jgi:hypothetical protein